MPSNRNSGSGKAGDKPLQPSRESGFVQKESSEKETQPRFQSELAVEIIEELYPLLLENCTDEQDEVDTEAVFESLAGLIGLFAADYAEAYGQEKALSALNDLTDLALQVYKERVQDAEEEA